MSNKVHKAYYDFVPSVVATMERPPSVLARMITWLVILLCIIAITWMYLAKVDIIISAQGKIVPSGKTKTIQAADEGVVKDIYVADGQLVQAGDKLIALDSTSPAADEQQLKNRFVKAQLTVQRLRVELGESIELGNDVNASDGILETENLLLIANMAAYDEQVNLLSHELLQHQAAVETSKAESRKLRMTMTHLDSMREKKSEQAEKGLVPRSEVEDIQFELESVEQDLTSSYLKTKEQQAKAAAALENIQAANLDRRSELLKKLAEAEHELDAVQQDLIKAKERIAYQILKAPVSGVIQQLAVNTIGGVVTKAQNLMTIVPENSELEMEAEILNKDIGFLEPQLPVKIKIDAFEYTRYGTLAGIIEWLGSDAVVDENKGAIYPTRIVLSETVLPNQVSGRIARVLPGMSATVDVVIGQRRLIEYFIGPMLRYKDESLTER